MIGIQKKVLAAAVLSLSSTVVESRNVFCHYLLGGTNDDNANKDMKDGKAMGCDAFALNLGSTYNGWEDSVATLFSAANNQGMKIFFSLDLAANNDLHAHDSVLYKYLKQTDSAYFIATPDGKPMLSTFHGGDTSIVSVNTWQTFIQGSGDLDLGNNVYFVPNFDDNDDQINNPEGFFNTYGGFIAGAFNWETAWPPEGNTHQNISVERDQTVATYTSKNNKSFMIGISPVQFKTGDYIPSHYYRIGDINMPQRMEEIFNMNPAPDFVEVITWNDGPESHYLGNVFESSGGDPDFVKNTDHSGWQPVMHSFINAWKSGETSSSAMRPITGTATGAMWYSPIFHTVSSCSSIGNSASAVDAISIAIILGDDAADYRINVYSGDYGSFSPEDRNIYSSGTLSVGLNYFSVPGINPGGQVMDLVKDSDGSVVMHAVSDSDQSVNGDTGAACILNPKVVGLTTDGV